MDETEDTVGPEVKRARLQALDTPQLDEGSHSAAVPARRQPAMHTKALRSVLKGARSYAFIHLTAHSHLTLELTELLVCLQCLLSRQVSSYAQHKLYATC